MLVGVEGNVGRLSLPNVPGIYFLLTRMISIVEMMKFDGMKHFSCIVHAACAVEGWLLFC